MVEQTILAYVRPLLIPTDGEVFQPSVNEANDPANGRDDPPPSSQQQHQTTSTKLTMSFIAKLTSPSFYTGAVASVTKRAQNYYHPMIRQNR